MLLLVLLVIIAVALIILVKRSRKPAPKIRPDLMSRRPCPKCAEPVMFEATMCPRCRSRLPVFTSEMVEKHFPLNCNGIYYRTNADGTVDALIGAKVQKYGNWSAFWNAIS